MRLSGLLDASSGVFVDPLRRGYDAAATAIEGLGELELIRYDDAPTDASADLSLWEEMAPVLGATIAAVNGLLAQMEVEFPGASLYGDVTHSRLHQSVQQAAAELKSDVSNFGVR